MKQKNLLLHLEGSDQPNSPTPSSLNSLLSLKLLYPPLLHWHIFQSQLPAIGTMMILNAISVLFNYSGLELIIKKDLDLDRELKVTGLGNILAGFCGAPPGHLALGGASLAYSIGARSRLSTVVVALLCAFALFFGSKILSVFPRVILGGLLFNLGLSFVVDWLINTWNLSLIHI